MVVVHILGGGPAGVSFAHYAIENNADKVIIYEQSSCVGGLARSWRHGDFILDTGPHIFHTDDKEIIEDWNSIGEELFEHGQFRSCNIHPKYPGKLFDYPISLQTLEKNLPREEYIEIKNQYLGAQKKNIGGTAKTFDEYVSNILGLSLANLFYKEYPEKLWGLKTSQMLAEWAPQRLSVREKTGPFYTKDFVAVAKAGTGSVFNRIVEKHSKEGRLTVHYDARVLGLKFAGNSICVIQLSNGDDVKVMEEDIVVSTLPATTLARMLGRDIRLNFRGVRTLYMFFNSDRILPNPYNWVYVTQPNLSFNRITEPTSMTKAIAPGGWSYICIESTYPSQQRQATTENDYKDVYNWLEATNAFSTESYDPSLNTYNYEDFVYPIQDLDYRRELTKYNSIVSSMKNLHNLGTGGEFHYSDIQIIFRKSKELACMLLAKEKNCSSLYIPHISSLTSEKFSSSRVNPKKSALNDKPNTLLHRLSGKNVPIIAEIGINHNGDIDLAKTMILAAKENGASFAKFQYYSESSRVELNRHTSYLHETADDAELSIIEIFKRALLTPEYCKELTDYGEKVGIYVFFTVFDLESAESISRQGHQLIKTASMDLNNLALHSYLAQSPNVKSIIISTGMSDIEEVKRTVAIYPADKEVMLMSCRSAYPTSYEDIDLGEITYLQECFGLPVGFSDHTEDLYASIASIAVGASFLERHFTISRQLVGPDNQMSLCGVELNKLSNIAEITSVSVQKKRKILHPVEQATFSVQKKSLRFPRDLRAGSIINTAELVSQAPPVGFTDFHISIGSGFYEVTEDVKALQPISESLMRFCHA